MFDHVQKKLTMIYTAMTGGILLLLLALLFSWNLKTKENEGKSAFENLWVSVSAQLQMNSVLSDSFLAQAEAGNRAIIHILENNQPLFFPGAWKSKTDRSQLIEEALKEAAKEGVTPNIAPVSSSVVQTSLMLIHGEQGDSYYGRLLVTSSGKGVKSVLLLTYITPLSAIFFHLLPIYGIIGLLGLLAVFLSSRYQTDRALQPAREAAKKQADFLAAASHELRSPLAVIRSCCSAAKGEPASTPSLLANIDRECSRMARLVSDMLLLASTDAGKWTLQKEGLEADTLMIETYETFLPICREKGLTLSLELPDETEPLPRFLADRQRLEQILTILMDNAIFYTPEGRTITLRLSEKKGSRRISAGHSVLEFEVADSGPGIPDEKKKLIFDRFYRADSSRSDKKHFGLGLSIAKELAELHGGSIRILDGEAGGSRFVVRIPVVN